jgi:hypothetical protein
VAAERANPKAAPYPSLATWGAKVAALVTAVRLGDVTRTPVQVPESPLVQPPSGALYVPVAELPFAEMVPEKRTSWPPSLIVIDIELPVTVPLIAPDEAHGLPARMSWPETDVPVCAIWPAAVNCKPKELDLPVKLQKPPNV